MEWNTVHSSYAIGHIHSATLLVAPDYSTSIISYLLDNNSIMARIIAVLPLLALLQNVIAFNFPSTRFMTNAILKMSDSDGPGATENAFSPSGYQVFLGNLPFTMDEGQLEQLIAGKAERYNINAARNKWTLFTE